MNRSQYTLNDKLADYFRRHAGEWQSAQQLAAVVGVGGWRTRVSNLTKAGFPLEKRKRQVWIEERQKWVTVYDRRYVPASKGAAVAASEADRFDANAPTPGRLI